MERFKKFSMFVGIFVVFTLLMSLGVTLDPFQYLLQYYGI